MKSKADVQAALVGLLAPGLPEGSAGSIAGHVSRLGARPGPAVELVPGVPSRRIARVLEAALVPATDVAAVTLAGAWLLPRAPVAAVYAAAVAVLLRAGRSDSTRLDPRVGDDAPAILRAVALPLLVLAPFLAGTAGGVAVLRAAPVLFGAVCAGRLVGHSMVRTLRARGYCVEAALVCGAGQIGQGLVETLQEHPRYGLRPIGFLEDDPYDRLPLPVLGTTDELACALAATGARRVVVAFGAASDASMVSVLRACDDAKVVVYVLPRLFELGVGTRAADVDEVRGISLIRLRRSALRRSSQLTKRAFDVAVAALALVMVSPVMFAAAVAVRLSSRGPVLFRQRRLGKNGRAFDVLKFRSMEVNDDSDTTWGVAADPRVTPVGSFLRRTSVDELPQLWNVLRGDMSIVGPRPERPHFSRIFGESIPGYGDRLRVPAGLTGWSQVHGLRGDTSIVDRAFFDNYYVEHWSLWLDVQIIGRTMRSALLHDYS
jgi:exopolysaccharide biosynthesis polyprenyl glycosylphosphotransferase